MTSHFLWMVPIWGAVGVVALLTVLAWRQRPRPGAAPFAIAMFCGTWWTAATAMSLFAATDSMRLFWTKVQWGGIVFIPVAWLLFALEYTGREEYVSFRSMTFLGVIPAVTLSLIMTNSLHELVFSSISIQTVGPLTLLVTTEGPWFWVHAIYSNLLLLAGTILVVQIAFVNRELYSGQVAAVLLIVLPPWVASLAFLSGFSPIRNLDPTPFTFVLTGVAGIAALRRFDFLDATPVTDRVARQSLIDSMEDGVVVIDGTDRIVETNPRANQILDGDRNVDGYDARTLIDDYDEILADGRDHRVTINVERGSSERIYEIQVTRLDEGSKGNGGKILIFHDVTDQQVRLQRLDVLNRVLRHNLRNEMNVVYGYADRLASDSESVDPVAVSERIKEKSMEMVELGDKAREIDEIMKAQGDPANTIELDTLLGWERERVETEHPDVSISVATTEGSAACHSALGTVLKIIVENAIDLNEDGRPEIRIEATVDESTITVSISDDGPGIPETDRQVLEAGEETKLKHGSGLGLWLANWGAQALSGDLTIRDDDAKDGGVSITVPRLDGGETDYVE